MSEETPVKHPTDLAKARADWKFHQSNTWFLGAMLGILALFYLVVGMRFLKPQVMIPTIVGLAALNVAVFLFSRRLVLWMTKAKELTGDNHVRVKRLVDSMLPRTGLSRAPTLYVMEDEQPNAFAFGNGLVGRGVAVTTGILDLLDDDELQAVLAHELGHLRARDTSLMTILSIFLSATDTVLSYVHKLGRASFFFSMAIEALVYLPRIWMSGISQIREFAADAFSAGVVGSPDPLIAAFEKLEKWIVTNRAKKRAAPWETVDKLLISHPGMTSRIHALTAMRVGASGSPSSDGGRNFAIWARNNWAVTGAKLVLAAASLYATYWMAPTIVHLYVFESLILGYADDLLVMLGISFASLRARRYWQMLGKDRLTLVITFVSSPLAFCGFLYFGIAAMKEYWLAESAPFAEVDALPEISRDKIRFTPEDVAAQEIVRRVQSSEFSPGHTRALSNVGGVGYIAPFVPQGLWNRLGSRNDAFLYYDDAGSEDERQRVTNIPSEPFVYGEGMEIFDDIRRRLVLDIGFFKSYPEIYYAPILENGAVKEVIGVVPYVSYDFRWGIFIPHWGGVVVFHADGTIVDLSPEEAQADPLLADVSRLYPESLMKKIVEAQRYDQGPISGLIRRAGKIEIPRLPGHTQMPFFLAMEDGSSRYVTMAEPDGDGYGLMRIYLVDARTGERTVYRFDVDDRPQDLLGPAKAISSVKSVQGFNWYEEDGDSKSGSYRVIEPRPVTRGGNLYWMLSIVPVDFARTVATVFVDAKTNRVVGPFQTRAETFAWLSGQAVEPTPEPEPTEADLCERLLRIRDELETMCPADGTASLSLPD